MKITENIYWTITGKVKDGELENMKKAIEAMIVATRTEDGAISYDFWLSEDSLKKIVPTSELSNQFLYEFTRGVDCKNPKDILF